MISTEREKIIALARECGADCYPDESLSFDYVVQLEAFYKAAQNEAYENVLDLKSTAFHIFGLGDQLPQGETMDAIQWYDASVRNLKEQS